jgi:fido (protein-threonine AMPylation protein)
MARDFEHVKAAGLCDGVSDVVEYERLVSIGQGSASAYLRILIEERSPLLAPKPQDLLQLYRIMFKGVYKGAGDDFRPGEFGRIPLDMNEYGKPKFGADAKIIRSELDKLFNEADGLFSKAAAQSSERQRRLDSLHAVGFWHYRFERIHPFKDGNGRLGRLISNHQIHHMLDPRARLLANAAEDTKKAYHTALSKAGRRNHLWPLEKFIARQINLSTGREVFSREDLDILNDQRPPAANPLAGWDPGNR